jgi:hypothetical protein
MFSFIKTKENEEQAKLKRALRALALGYLRPRLWR